MTAVERSEPVVAEGAGQRLKAASSFSIGKYSADRVTLMASAAPAGSTDPVDRALADAVGAELPGSNVPVVAAADVDPARPDRRFSLTRVREMPLPGDRQRDLVVMRGELRSVLAQATLSREDRLVLTRNAELHTRRGCRPLAVATALVGEDGTVGDFRMQGFVAVRPARATENDDALSAAPESWARVNLWSVTLRYQHWLNVALIFILSCTGYYIMDPFFGPVAESGEPTGFLMGYVRLIHFSAAFIWLVVGLTRVVLAVTSRDHYLRWPTLWPLKTKQDVKHLGQVMQHYAFLKEEAPFYLAHNPLQQLAYTSLYLAGGLQMATGFVLYSLYNQNNPFWVLVAMPVHWFGIAPIRLFHAMMMFLLWAFVIMHVYLAVRADSLERHGGISAMLNGGVWVRRGSKPVDAPEIE